MTANAQPQISIYDSDTVKTTPQEQISYGRLTVGSTGETPMTFSKSMQPGTNFMFVETLPEEIRDKIDFQTCSTSSSAEKEVSIMGDQYVNRGEFDAHIRRLDDRMGAMEEKILSRLDRVVSELSLRDEARAREFNIRDENREKEMERVYESIQHSIEITRSENKNTRWTMLALTVTILAGIISAIVPIGWQIFREIVK